MLYNAACMYVTRKKRASHRGAAAGDRGRLSNFGWMRTIRLASLRDNPEFVAMLQGR